MKSKKLFAILTLVAFMMTLVPMAAFGAGGDAGYIPEKSSLTVEDSTVDSFINLATNVDNAAKFTITFKDGNGDPIPGASTVDFNIKASKSLAYGVVDMDEDDAFEPTTADAAGVIDIDNSSELTTSDGLWFDNIPVDASGRVTFWMGAESATSFDVSVYYSNEGDAGVKIGGTKTITVKRAANQEIAMTVSTDDDGNNVVDPDDYLLVANGLVAGEGLNLIADYGVEDKEITFKQSVDGGTWTTIGTAETDDEGIAMLWIDAATAGTYKFKAYCGGDDSGDAITVKVFSGEPSVLADKTVSGTIPLDELTNIDVYVKDDAGNLIKDSLALFGLGGNIVKYEFVTVPEGSDLDDDEYFRATNVRGYARYGFTPDEVGKYVVKLTLESDNGTLDDELGSDSKTLEFNVVEMGTVTKLTSLLVDDTYQNVIPGIRYLEDVNDDATQSGYLLPFLNNAAGAKFFTLNGSELGIEFASSNPAAVTVGEDGALTVVDDEFVGTVTITMTHDDDNVVATADVKVVGGPNALTATPTVTAKAADVKLQLVDKAGNPTTSTSGRDTAKDAINVIAPAGVTISGVSGISSNGTGSFKLAAEQPGKYTVTVMATVDETAGTAFGVDTNAAQKTIAKTFEVEFTAAPTDKPVAGAKTVTMFIGAPGYTQDGVAKVSDVAPFIKDGRTFVAVRPVADAFGAVIGWNEATQTVTLTRADVTVTIVIGSNAVTVVKGGVTSTVTADVAAFIKDGRTVLPFRAVGEAFGAAVNYDAATQAVTYVQ